MSMASSSDRHAYQSPWVCSRYFASLHSATQEVSLLFPKASPSMWALVPSHHPGLLLTQELSSCHHSLSLLQCQFLHVYSLLPINEMLSSSFPCLKSTSNKTSPIAPLLLHLLPHFSLLHYKMPQYKVLSCFHFSLTALVRSPVVYILQNQLLIFCLTL